MLCEARSFSSTPRRYSFFAVALALREQLLATGEVPVGASDVSVDMIITPDETIFSTGGDSNT